MLPLIALVGRPNVGKSTLFNRMTKSRQALVDDTPGLTRDRQYGEGTWRGRSFRVVDTGGFEPDPGEIIAGLIKTQAMVAIEEADLVVLVTDAKAGVSTDDAMIGEMLRKSGKPALAAVNKAEVKGGADLVHDFWQMGLETLVPVSAAHGLGIADLFEAMFDKLGGLDREAPPEEEEGTRIAIIGCPNVGKSSLVNAILGEERQVASDIPGTTRDSVDNVFTSAEGDRFTLVDTAGIRRKGKVTMRIEKFSIIAALKALDRAQMALLVLDAERGITSQDQRIGSYAHEAGRGLILVVNKWDLMTGGKAAEKAFLETIEDKFPTLGFAPVLFISAKTGRQVPRILKTAKRVGEACASRLPTSGLNRWLKEVVAQHPPSRVANRMTKFRYVTQVSSNPPSFAVFGNRTAEGVAASYRRYLENQMRKAFELSGTPVRFFFRKGENPFEEKEAGKKARGGRKKVDRKPGKRKASTKKKSCRISGGNACNVAGKKQRKKGRG